MKLSEPYDSYGELGRHDVVKSLALLAMVADHVGVYFLPNSEVLRVFGRMAMPLFLFLVGYSGMFAFRKSLLCGALILAASSLLPNQPFFPLNILFVILLVRGAMSKLAAVGWVIKYWYAVLFVAVLCWFPLRSFVEYGSLPLLFAFCGYFVRRNKSDDMSKQWMFLALLLYGVTQYVIFGFSVAMSVVFFTVLLVTGIIMFYYDTINVSHITGAKATLCKLVSRYSLSIYVVHLFVFRAIATLFVA